MKNDNIENCIAITGISCRFPGADNIEQLWQNLAEGVSSIGDISDETLREAGVCEKLIHYPGYIKRHGGPENIEFFDANFFGISPDEARYMDVQHRLMLECAHESLESANINLKTNKDRIGVFGGIAMPHYLLENLRQEIPDVMNEINQRFATNMNIGLGNDRSYASSRISNKLNLEGPAINVDAACATSMFAIHLACRSLLDFESDVAITAAARIHFPYTVGFLHEEGGMSSPDGDIYSFDQRANGTMFTNGAASIILKRAEEAIAAGDDIIALIRGSAINNDGSDKVGFTAPSLNGQRKVIFEAQSVAEVSASEISYIEAHGTGTALGDPLEFAALKHTFEKQTDKKHFCHIGTLKPNLGHMEAVSGIAGVIKTALMLQRKKLLPIRNYKTPNPELELADSPFKICTEYQDWQTDSLPRKAGVSSFGVGGNNSHVILEEYVPPAKKEHGLDSPQKDEIILLSAKTQAALDQMRENMASYLSSHTEVRLRDISYTSQYFRQAFGKRMAVVASDTREAIAKLQSSGSFAHGEAGKHAEKISFMFPGQGSQHLGMVQDLYLEESEFRALVDECAQILHSLLDPSGEKDIRRIMFSDDKSDSASDAMLNQTQYAQPSLFVAEYCLAKWWMAHGVQPDAMIGHSIGEYVAACLAGVFTLESALHVVSARGRLMQGMAAGSMLSVNLSKDEILAILPEDCDLAAHNAPTSMVVSAPDFSIAAFTELLDQKEISYSRLHTSHAFHSRMMEPMLEEFKQVVEVAQPRAPQLPFISNITAEWIKEEQATSADYWVAHLRGTVNFSDGLRRLVSEQKMLLLEVGPGTTLSQLAKKQQDVSPSHVICSQGHVQSEENRRSYFRRAIAALWCQGAELDWQALYPDHYEQPRKVSIPTYAFDKKRYLIERVSRDEVDKVLSDERLEFDHWFSTPSWQRDVGKSVSNEMMTEAKNERWLVWANLSPVCQNLINKAAKLGISVVAIYQAGLDLPGVDSVEEYQLASQDFESYNQLLSQFKQQEQRFERVISCWAIDSLPSGYFSQSNTINTSDKSSQNNNDQRSEMSVALEQTFYSQINIVKALSILEVPVSLSLITNGIVSVSGSESLNPTKAALLAILRVVPLEFKNISCQLVDVEIDLSSGLRSVSAKRNLDMLLAEISMPEANRACSAIRGNYCWRLGHEALDIRQYPQTDKQLQAKAGGTYIITGGAGGIGLLFANWLANQSAANLVLVGRSPLPEKERWQGILKQDRESETVDLKPEVSQSTLEKLRAFDDLRKKGANVRYVALDVTDADAIASLVATTVAKYGGLNGIIHSAGIAGDGIISLKTKEQADGVIYPKVLGAYNLIQGVRHVQQSNEDLAIDFMVLNSSLYAVVGGVGQVDYCAANNMLDAIAYQESTADLPILSINWGPWENLGMTNKNSSQAPAKVQQSPAINWNEYEKVEHSLIKGYRRTNEHRYQFIAPLTVKEHWILDEHRIEGEPVVPGTSLIEMFITVGETLKHNSGKHLVLSNVLFLKPITVPEQGERLLTLCVDADQSNQGSYTILVESNKNGVSTQYAMAEIRFEDSQDFVSIDLPESLKTAYDQEVLDFHGKEQQAVDSENDFIKFGRRWHSIKEVRYRNNAALNFFKLPEQFADDVDSYRVHPALLDLATGVANGIWLQYPDQTKNLNGEFLPSGYDQIHFYHPLPQEFYAESKLMSVSDQGSITFDIRLIDQQGSCLMNIKGFRINHVTQSPNAHGDEYTKHSFDAELEDKCILPEEGVQAFSRLLGMTHIQNVVVSNRSIEFMLRMEDRDEQSSDDADFIERPDISTEFVAAQNQTQETLVALWTETLGIKAIGINDNFYDVGGDSLVATKLVANIRRQFNIVVALNVLFANATIAELADHIDAMLYVASSANSTREKTEDESEEELEEGVL